MPFVFRRGMIKLAPRWGDCFIRRDGSSLRPSPLRPPCTQFLSLMHAVLKHGSRAQEEGLFKAASACQVLCSLVSSEDLNSLWSLPSVTSADVFISHSWSCFSWLKVVAMCHHLNLDFAIVSSTLACILSVFTLRLHAGSFNGIAQQSGAVLFEALICFPMGTFLISYFSGQCICRKSFWFDRICVSQANATEKAVTLQAVPAFVANSRQMLLLVDGTYFKKLGYPRKSLLKTSHLFSSFPTIALYACFQSSKPWPVRRLWCNYELAVAAKTVGHVQILPIWEPVWTLSSLGVGCIFVPRRSGLQWFSDRSSGLLRNTYVINHN